MEERFQPYRDDEYGFSYGVRLSAILHGGFILFVLVGGWIFPVEQKPYVPSLRVDLVGLPDILKKDLDRYQGTVPPQQQDKAPVKDKIETPSEKKAADKPSSTKEIAAPDEMALKPKKETERQRDKKLKSALSRIKALSRITQDEVPEEKSDRPQALIKGNQLSSGSSLSGDAKENSESGYYDQVLGVIRSNWSLPVWLARQKYNARVKVLIDAGGNVLSIQFKQASGNAAFDEQVKRSILESQPLPKPPENLRKAILSQGVSLGFPL